MVEELILSLKKCTTKDDTQFVVDIIKAQCSENQINQIRKIIQPRTDLRGAGKVGEWRWSIQNNIIFYNANSPDTELSFSYFN